MKRDRKEYARAYYLKNREKFLIEARQYAKDNPEKIAATKKRYYEKVMADPIRKAEWEARAKAGHERRGPVHQRAYALMRDYGITLEEHDAMFAKQDGKCAICRCTRPDGCRMRSNYLYVDHDHKTGKVRGLLCSACNTHLSSFENYEQEMRGYLDSH